MLAATGPGVTRREIYVESQSQFEGLPIGLFTFAAKSLDLGIS